METLHIQTKKTLTKKTQASEIKKILLIDQDKDSALSAALAQEGYDLVLCDSVQEAWSLVYPYRPHLIILHLRNSNPAGLSDIQECRALAEDIPIVLAVSAQVNRALIKAMQHEPPPMTSPSFKGCGNKSTGRPWFFAFMIGWPLPM